MGNQALRMEGLLSARTFPIRYLVIPKCGCTFVKNLLWRLDHGENYANPPRIHEKTRDFARAADFNLSLEDVRGEAYSFVILRDPIDRFLSLYSDKVVGEGYRKFVPLRRTLQDHHGLHVAPKTPEDHRRNCHILIDWIEENLSQGNEIGRNPHWTPQHYRMDTIRGFDMKVLMLNGLDANLTLLLGKIVPDIEQILGKLERYASNSKELKNQVVDPGLRDRIHQIYRKDRENFDQLREAWSKITPASAEEIPRASNIFV